MGTIIPAFVTQEEVNQSREGLLLRVYGLICEIMLHFQASVGVKKRTEDALGHGPTPLLSVDVHLDKILWCAHDVDAQSVGFPAKSSTPHPHFRPSGAASRWWRGIRWWCRRESSV